MEKRKSVILLIFALVIVFAMLSLVACNPPPTAEAKNERYATVSSEEMKDNSHYELKTSFSDDGNYYYVFYLGYIEHVPLQTQANSFYYGGDVKMTQKFVTTKTTSQTVERMTSTAKSLCVSSSISASQSVATESEISAGLNLSDIAEVKSAVRSRVELGMEETFSSSSTLTTTESFENSQTFSEENSEETTFQFNEKCEKGYYRYVLMGKVDVFGVAMYNLKLQKFYTTTYETITANYFKLDYSTDASFSDNKPGKLHFDMTEEELNELLNSKPSTGEIPSINTGFAGGSGTVENPYKISTAIQLKNINKNLAAHYILISDIDVSGTNWEPIGLTQGEYKKFCGSLDGRGHSISGLQKTDSPTYINVDAYVGLFGIVENATIKNLKLTNVHFLFPNSSRNPSYVYVGALAGKVNNSCIEKVSVEGKVQGGWDYGCAQEEYIGGIIGAANSSTIKFCANKAEVLAYHWLVWAGGILGFCQDSKVEVLHSYNTGYIEIGTGYQIGVFTGAAGGIVGRVNGNATIRLEGCYSCCRIKNYNGYYRDIGGIVATATNSANKSTIKNNCYCVNASYSTKNNFNDTIHEVKNVEKEGQKITYDELCSGNSCGPLHAYDLQLLLLNDENCWIFEKGKLPKLFWEI